MFARSLQIMNKVIVSKKLNCAVNIHIYIRDVKDCTISRLLSMAMNMLFMMVRHAQKVKGEA